MMISRQLQLGYRPSFPMHLHFLWLPLSSVIELDFKWNYNAGKLWRAVEAGLPAP